MTITANINRKSLVINLLIPLAVGGISALITGDEFAEYKSVTKPYLSPPAVLFPIVWTVLYILMGISFYIVWERDGEKARRPVTVYAIQLFLNFLWPVFFFSFRAYFFSFVWLILLWMFVLAEVIEFSRISKAAGLLQIPYLLWTAFAAYLNFGVYLLN